MDVLPPAPPLSMPNQVPAAVLPASWPCSRATCSCHSTPLMTIGRSSAYTPRGVASSIPHAIGQPSSLRLGIVEHFIERTSSRGVVDDPGDNRPLIADRRFGQCHQGALAGLSGIVEMSQA